MYQPKNDNFFCQRLQLDTRTPLAITLGANVVNLALDPLLIFRCGYGVGGAAAATAVAEWLAAAAYLACLWRRREQLGGCRNTELLAEDTKELKFATRKS